MRKCPDSGQMVLYPIAWNGGNRCAWCGCCGRTVSITIRPGDTNRIPHYADHEMPNA